MNFALPSVNIAGAAVIFSKILPVLIIGGAALFVGWLFMRAQSYKIDGFFGKVLADGRKQYFTDKARKVKTRDGAIKWVWRRLKMKTEPAPEDVQELTMKGRIVVQGYVSKENNIVWRKDNVNYKELTLSGFQPVTNEDRRAHAYEMEKAYNHLQGFMNKYGTIVVSGFILVIVLVVFMAFFGKVMQPTIDAQKQVNKYADTQLAILKQLEQMDNDIQYLSDGEVNAARKNNTEPDGVVG